MYLYAFEGVENPIILEDNTFGHITFELFKGIRINKFGSNVFKKQLINCKVFGVGIVTYKINYQNMIYLQ